MSNGIVKISCDVQTSVQGAKEEYHDMHVNIAGRVNLCMQYMAELQEIGDLNSFKWLI